MFPSPIDLDAIRRRIDSALSEHLSERAEHLASLSEDLRPVAHALIDFCADGKRIRPLFAYCGWRAAGGGSADQHVIDAVSGLELIQAAALVHDDIIDESDSRRGRPSAHRTFEHLHLEGGFAGSAEKYGVAVAILLGDLALIWADAVVQGSQLSDAALLRVRSELDLMRIEVMAGQFLDVLEQARPAPPELAVQSALKVAALKSASYTVARPLLIGAAIAGAGEDVRSTYATFGQHIGIAFQLRDDLLGVYGDPAVTGKPAGDDLREGKRTALIARALDHLGDRTELTEALGDPDLTETDIERVRGLISDSGATADVEQIIEERTATALDALDRVDLDPVGRDALRSLAAAATSRSR
ncbi:polyprenyl synthetase family protein [Cumulibacter soli]|uniref:polyprenyl synthetase family protein n=1 Tax=Cumulibacter soli TaxID=2546344 RepID=UPI001ABA8418|nr:polyprenyl synthetase family protein [Cumulibacter soli]